MQIRVDSPPREIEAPSEPSYHNERATKADDFMPISSLNTMNPDWIIRARVTKKGQVKTFNKQTGGQGKLFSVDLIDAYGTQI